MTSKIILLNYCRYQKKDSDKMMTRLQFAFAEVQTSENFNGVSIIDCYYSGTDAFKALNKDLLLKPVEAEFDIVNDYYNPLRETKILKSVNGIKLR